MVSAASVAALAGPAYAQQAQTPAGQTGASTGVAEIVVTAQKREQRVNSVPMSITATSGAKLEQLGIKQPRDLVKLAPGFSFAISEAGSPIYTLRGVGFNDTSLGGRATVSVYTDEAPLPFAIETRGADLDLERVEVLKGPQGTLFGQNATGGAVNYIDAKPTKTFEAGADLSYGNYNAVDVGGFVSGPLGDTLGARLSVDHTQSDGWQKSYTDGLTNGAGDFTTGRLLLTWTPDSRLKAQLNINGFVDRSQVQAGQLIAITPSTPAAAPLVPGLLTYPLAPQNDTAADWTPGQDYHRHNDFFQSNLRLDYNLTDDLTVTSLTSYSRYTEDQLQDADGMTLDNADQRTVGSISSISQELRLAGSLFQQGHFVLGADYAHDRVLESDYDHISQSTSAFTFVGFGLPLFSNFKDSDNQDSTTTAVFGNLDYNLTKDIQVYGGARFTQSNDKFNGCTADSGDGDAAGGFGFLENYLRSGAGLPPNPPIPNGGCVTADATFTPGLAVGTLDQNNVSWRFGAQWTPAERTLLYANISKGYKAGGFPDLAATLSSQFTPASQESVVAYEAGFKTALIDRTLQLNGAVFYYDYRDKQVLGYVLDPVFGALLRLVNVPKSQITGAEAQVTWTPVRGLTINAGVSYIDSRILGDFINYDSDGALRNFGGEAFPDTPKLQVIADADYRWDLTDSLDGFIGGNLTYQGATNAELGELPLLATKAYTLVDLRGGIQTKDGAWKLSLWGRNVGNAYYWVSAVRPLDTTVRFTGMPATFGVALSYRYQ
jgi:outer membrane receptor protein involved in Fe transport